MVDSADERFVQLAVTHGFVTPAQYEEATAQQKKYAAQGVPMTMRELLLARGVLKPEDVPVILRARDYQSMRNEDLQFGQIAVDNGFVAKKDVRAGLEQQAEAHRRGEPIPRLGALLLESGKLSPQQVRAVLKAQDRINTAAPAGAAKDPVPVEPPPSPAAAGGPGPGAEGAPPRSDQDDVPTIAELIPPWTKTKPNPPAV